MARLYNAGQYNQEFVPKRLGNWEVPRWFPDRKVRDPFNFKPTEPIVDDRGRFLPGAPRANRNPWNNHVGTFDQPPRITRAIANELASRPPNRLRYWDKPNQRLRAVSTAAKQLQGGPGFSLVAEGPGYPQHRNYFLNKQDYVDHKEQVEEQDAVAQEFLRERRRRQVSVQQRVEQVKELTAELHRQQEERRREEAERDVQWLLQHRNLHNVVPRTHDWSGGRPDLGSGCVADDTRLANAARRHASCRGDEQEDSASTRLVSTRSSAERARPTSCSGDCGGSPREQRRSVDAADPVRCWETSAGSREDQDEGIQEDDNNAACWEKRDDSKDLVRDDGRDSGVGSVEDGHLPDDSPDGPKAPYPQFEDDSGDLLKPSNPSYPDVDPSFSRRAAQDPTITSYPEPERVREEGYPEMFTTETDLAAPVQDHSPPPREEPPDAEDSLPRVEGAALKCGRNPRRPPSRPYARAQFSVVPEPESPQPRDPSPGPALANAYSSFQVARQLQKENLEHNPLPDTVDDDLFKRLNSQRHPNPGIALDVEPDAAAVGWRSFNAPGPTNCSKMKVYRPKTAAPTASRTTPGRSQRPSTGHPKLLAKDHVSEMDLAICWDLVPAYPEDEPKPTPHIDGSNGSAAPGIFSLVHHTEEDGEPRANGSGRNSNRHCHGPAGTSTPPIGKGTKSPPKPPSVESVHSGSSLQNNKGRSAGPPDHALHERLHALERQRSAIQRQYNAASAASVQQGLPPSDLCDFRKRNGCIAGMQGCGDGTSRDDPRNLQDHLAELRKQRHANRHLHQSMPDLTEHRGRQARSASQHRGGGGNHQPRPCAACAKVPSPQPLRRPKSEYKMAFKAGKPVTSLSTNSSFDTPPSQHSGCGAGCGAGDHHGGGGGLNREVRVPKQRAPFARKNYAITSLTQPFSLWPKETGHAYPEHWRLASVYQHSFKPVHARSKPLLKTVYQ